jgi:hypothetical protein
MLPFMLPFVLPFMLPFMLLFASFLVHPEPSPFLGLNFGANPWGIHFAAGPDRMHLMFEGLGKAIHTWLCAVLLKTGICVTF